ncbi:MAG: alpha/beta hydrolase [Bacteroides sp.]|nr:alpha/beta hydrolase [Bacteroides sp.]
MYAYPSAALSAGEPVTINLFDTARNRQIPLAIYMPAPSLQHKTPVILSHGYDKNIGGSYKTYSYLAETLADAGYYVISIQHELPGDDLLAMEGEFYITRMPNWERGMENILFTIREIKKLRPDLNWSECILIGHSNGGDMSMLTATCHPEEIEVVISLDHRRMPVPRTGAVCILSLRGCDYEADPGVLPDPQEGKELNITIEKFADIGHSDMDDKGSREQKEKITTAILRFLSGRTY